MKLLSLQPGPSQYEHHAEFGIGTHSPVNLSDHGFQGMAVLPGTFFVVMAAILHRELVQAATDCIRNISFLSPVILSETDTVVGVDVSRLESLIAYRFYEKTNEPRNAGAAEPRRYAATLEIPLNKSMRRQENVEPLSVDDFQARAQAISSAQFYEPLRKRGNQYGPAFQNVLGVWHTADEVLGQIANSQHSTEGESHGALHPLLLDAATQLLAAFVLDQPRSFLLRSIRRIEFQSDHWTSKSFWGRARHHRTDHGEATNLGDVDLFDESGAVCAILTGVAAELLAPAETLGPDALRLVVASNFTAEPVEDALRFWAGHFGLTAQVEFAPYNQVFQQLLDSNSLLHQDGSAANFLLLSLEEWAMQGPRSRLHLRAGTADECFPKGKRYFLPNGLEIVHLNAYETDYVYREIFEDECYLRHGISLPDGATVVDIGANIGLFTLFVMERCRNSTIYAFEPAPPAYAALQANCKAYGTNAHVYNLGVSNRSGTAPFTFYERSSVFSGFHSDEEEDRKAIEAVVRNTLNSTVRMDGSSEEYVRELSSERLAGVVHECSLTTISDVIRQNGIQTIDLLKIDAEKSEFDILCGIGEDDWPKIRQVVMEIHDPSRSKYKVICNMLSERGYRCAVVEEELLKASGLVNLYATRAAAAETIDSANCLTKTTPEPTHAFSAAALERNVNEFSAALQTLLKRSGVPLVLCFCPRTPAANAQGKRQALNEAEQKLLAATAIRANVAVVTSNTLAHRYPVIDTHDPHSYQAGHVPYTPEGYAAIGTALFRAFWGLQKNPFKVIALDCDNTLWQGVCGEDGPSAIEITPSHRELQQFMLARMQAGMLLTLCSKNNEQDVFDVFEQRSDMVLRRQHLASWRINWDNKSESIKALARELNLGLDSFVFVDDNPLDCADVRINCSSVLTLQLPHDPELLPRFLQHIWAFDSTASTTEDQGRTRMYQENAQREAFREETVSLKDFIDGLQLQVRITDAAAQDLGRVSQLTYRTNQFNFTTVRRSESEVRDFLRRPGARCLVVRVADRFGDYGLVGVVMYEGLDDRYRVDTFLLSCRVLGRGVEHAVLREVGQRAVSDAKGLVELTFRRSDKNLPAQAFLSSLNGCNADLTSCALPAGTLASLVYNPVKSEPEVAISPSLPKSEAGSSRLQWAFGAGGANDRLQEIGENLYDVRHIADAIARRGLGTEFTTSPVGGPGVTLQSRLAVIWQRVLGKSLIASNENFFEAGGTSLKAVQLVAMIRRDMHLSLSIATVFECPTVNLMAARLNIVDSVHPDNATSPAALRGQRRRAQTARHAR